MANDELVRERELTEREIGTAIGPANRNDELRSSRSVLRGCLARELVYGKRRRAVWRGIDWPRGKEWRETKFPKKKMMDLAFCITVGDHPILALPFSFGGLQFA